MKAISSGGTFDGSSCTIEHFLAATAAPDVVVAAAGGTGASF